jgi:hypothetical protein
MLNSHGNVFSFSKGRCYDHNFVRFSQKNSVMITVRRLFTKTQVDTNQSHSTMPLGPSSQKNWVGG